MAIATCVTTICSNPLSACSRRDLAGGDGSELGKGGGRGKIQALHSSAALACNFFDYWRGRDLGLLSRALGISVRLCAVAFEQKFPTRLGGIAPNLDVVLYGCDGSLFAVESKFTEPFTKSKTKCFLKPPDLRQGGEHSSGLRRWPVAQAAWNVTFRNSAGASRCSRRSAITRRASA